MRPDVYKSVIVDDDNLTCILYRRQTMRNNHNGSTHDGLVNGLLHQVLRLGVERAGG